MSTQPRQTAGPSRTITQEETEAGPSHAVEHPPSGVLKLRGGPVKKQRVVWSDETVDNEGMDKKKSKICCIYHKPRAFDESSSDESSDCSSADEAGPSRAKARSKGHHEHGVGHGHRHRDGGAAAHEAGQQSESSESDGGAGDGRARSARKPKPKSKGQHRHAHDCDHGKGKMNKYDAQPRPDTGVSGHQNKP
ncbi:hypothetical protein IAU60_003968 [Kwoniella sp. DSM 27419]